MRLLDQLRNDCESSPDVRADAAAHPIVFHRVFNLVCAEIPGYQADIGNGLSQEEAKEQWKQRVEARYRARFRVDEAAPTEGGPYGFITIAVILAALISTCISWLIWKGLDYLWELWKKRHPHSNMSAGIESLVTDAELTSAGDE